MAPLLSHTFRLTLPSETQILLERAFPAPPEVLFDALTRPEHVRRWWNPFGGELSHCEADLRVGGVWRYVLAGPDGHTAAFHGTYQALDRPTRIQTTQVYESAELGDPQSLVTLTLRALGSNRTLLSSLSDYPDVYSRDGHLHSGMEPGVVAVYNQLDTLLQQLFTHTV